MLTSLPLPWLAHPTTSLEVGLDVSIYRAGDVEDRNGRDPKKEGRVLTITYPNLSPTNARIVEDALRNSKGVARFTYAYAGVTGCYRADSGYEVSYERLGATITLSLTQCSCPHTMVLLPEGIYWDKPLMYWDNFEVWD